MSLLKRIGGTTPGTEEATGTQRPAATSTLRREEVRPGGSARDHENAFTDLKLRVQSKLISELDPNLDLSNTTRVRRQVEEVFNSILDSESIVLSRAERMRMFEGIAADILGYGPLQQFLADDDISEIMVNGPRQIYIEKRGKLIKTDVVFYDDDHVLRIIDRIVAPLGRRIDESSPMVDARLPDGSRVNAIIRPLSLIGPVITIRKFRKDLLR